MSKKITAMKKKPILEILSEDDSDSVLVSSIKNSPDEVKGEIKGVKGEIKGIKGVKEIREIKETRDMSEMKERMMELQTLVKSLVLIKTETITPIKEEHTMILRDPEASKRSLPSLRTETSNHIINGINNINSFSYGKLTLLLFIALLLKDFWICIFVTIFGIALDYSWTVQDFAFLIQQFRKGFSKT
jgi:hypothetical protein